MRLIVGGHAHRPSGRPSRCSHSEYNLVKCIMAMDIGDRIYHHVLWHEQKRVSCAPAASVALVGADGGDVGGSAMV